MQRGRSRTSKRLEPQAESELKASRIAHGSGLPVSRQRIRWVCAGSKGAVQTHSVHMVDQIEPFGQCLEANSLRQLEGAAQPCAHAEKIKPVPYIPVDEDSVHGRPRSRALDGLGPGSDVERERRIVLEHRAQLEAVADFL